MRRYWINSWSALTILHLAIADGLFGNSPRADLDFLDLVKYDGYTAEEYTVTTEDGYILTLFRLPFQKGCSDNASKVPMLFMHGMVLSGDDCIVPGPGKAHCYTYVDECIDMWVGNSRGTYYSRKHTTLDPDHDSEYWYFTYEDLAYYDLPALIDYILQATGKSQLIYVGHSQGVTDMLVLASERPEYNAKIKVAFGLSPTAWLDHATSPLINLQSLISILLLNEVAIPLTGNLTKEIFARGGVTQTGLHGLCTLGFVGYPICSIGIFVLLGYNRFQISDDILPVLAGHTPSGTSLRNVVYTGQIKNAGFRKLDYGSASANQAKYGQPTPPAYDLEQISHKWVFLASHGDTLGAIADVNRLHKAVSTSTTCIVKDKTFGHLDFVYGKDLVPLVASVVLKYLNDENYTC